MRISITISKFDYKGTLEKLPSIDLSSDESDYWLLLPLFEEIEEKTGKLIDLGEDTFYEEHELEIIQDILNKALKTVEETEPEEGVSLERDDERLGYLFSRLADMVNICIAHKQKLISKPI